MASGLPFLAAILLGNGAVPVPDSLPDQPAQITDNPDSPEAIFEDVQRQIMARQVRVERRVIVRITPFSSRRAASEMDIPPPRQPPVTRARSDGTHRCIPLSQVAGIRLSPQRQLLLFMRDRRVFSADFERSCPVQGFYSGFYVERPRDGLLCAGREELHARSGADCMLGGFRELHNSQDGGDGNGGDGD
ncbi:hypothetical protein [Croceicoccus mobilis]|uniref:Uncharacterized protein n=1 Tax=Croceicoccus mobilis TaxID=1703339 RepID=A0A917DRJ2_9SPHN|nr:hypothetical protein [Croceicoccus mobilis]GGD63191.1 hypothetical protein GCM10010990_10850 [Croceicoccus mobilis]